MKLKDKYLSKFERITFDTGEGAINTNNLFKVLDKSISKLNIFQKFMLSVFH